MKNERNLDGWEAMRDPDLDMKPEIKKEAPKQPKAAPPEQTWYNLSDHRGEMVSFRGDQMEEMQAFVKEQEELYRLYGTNPSPEEQKLLDEARAWKLPPIADNDLPF